MDLTRSGGSFQLSVTMCGKLAAEEILQIVEVTYARLPYRTSRPQAAGSHRNPPRRGSAKSTNYPTDDLSVTILLPNHKHGRAKVAHYSGREWRPKGRVGESLEYSDPAAGTKIALHHGRSLWNKHYKVL